MNVKPKSAIPHRLYLIGLLRRLIVEIRSRLGTVFIELRLGFAHAVSAVFFVPGGFFAVVFFSGFLSVGYTDFVCRCVVVGAAVVTSSQVYHLIVLMSVGVHHPHIFTRLIRPIHILVPYSIIGQSLCW